MRNTGGTRAPYCSRRKHGMHETRGISNGQGCFGGWCFISSRRIKIFEFDQRMCDKLIAGKDRNTGRICKRCRLRMFFQSSQQLQWLNVNIGMNSTRNLKRWS